jgi:hypothetical protein
MVTKEQALGDERYFHFSPCSYQEGPRGGIKTNIIVYRRNGKTKLWKRDEKRFQLPIKSGFFGPCDYITEKNAYRWHAESECAVLEEVYAKLGRRADAEHAKLQQDIPL